MPICRVLRQLRAVVCLVAALLVGTPSALAGSVVLPEAADRVAIGGNLDLLEDPLGELLFERVSAADYAEKFTSASSEKTPNLGFTTSAWWVRLTLTSTADEPVAWLLEYTNAPADSVTLFHVTADGETHTVKTGDLEPFDTRPVPHHTYVFPLELAPGERREVYLRVKSEGSVPLNLLAWKPEAFYASAADQAGIEGLYYGVVIILSLFNFLMFLYFRSRTYIWFVAYMAGFAAVQLALSGVGFRYVWPGLAAWNAFAMPVTMFGAFAAALMFSAHFLEVQTRSPLWSRVLMGLTGLCVVAMLASNVIPYSLAVRLASVAALAVVFTLMGAGVWVWRSGYRPARFFLLAWTGFLVGCSLVVLSRFGVLPTSVFFDNSMRIGNVFQILLFSVALTDRISLIRKEREEAQRRRLEEEKRSAQMAEAFGRYVAPEVAQKVLDDPDAMALGGRLQEVTILMSDLRGFSGLTRVLGPRDMVELLNRYLERMTDVIVAHGGMINEFIGDAILAIFGTPEPGRDDALRAARAAIAMQVALVDLNREQQESGGVHLEMGIGIHTGDAVVGNIGSSKRVKWGVVGDTVNMTARVESLTTGSQVLVSEACLERLADGEVEIGPRRAVQVKGRTALLEVAALQAVPGSDLRMPEIEAAAMSESDCRAAVHRMDGKQIRESSEKVQVLRLGPAGLVFEGDVRYVDGEDVAIRLAQDDDWAGPVYAKVQAAEVTSDSDAAPTSRMIKVVFTSVDPDAQEHLDRLAAGSGDAVGS